MSYRAGIKMKEPKPQFSYIVENIKKDHADLAYIHVVEPRASGDVDRKAGEGEVSIQSFLNSLYINTFLS